MNRNRSSQRDKVRRAHEVVAQALGETAKGAVPTEAKYVPLRASGGAGAGQGGHAVRADLAVLA
jgi:hypothetical protein